MSKIITVRVAQEIVGHEAIVREAYRDSAGVWTWSVGITNSSGHRVYPRYKDNPQTLRRCLEVFVWVLRTRYLPAVLEVFDGIELSENEFGAALSFHYNTGGLRRAAWAKRWKAGLVDDARRAFMNWSKPPEIIGRRQNERDLFFDGRWSVDGQAIEYPVAKPSYRPQWSAGKKVEIRAVLEELLNLP
ncbi:MAG: hypothetical protein HKN11_01560 [Rhizobiales bacterium]|nr:hypothetical protein [Hyphomicrobiales bacterium]